MAWPDQLGSLRHSRWAAPLAVALAIVLLAANELSYRRAAAVIAEREQLLSNRNAIGGLLRSVLEAETGQRGYLITGRPEYREPYLRATTEVEVALTQLADRYAKEPDRLHEVHELSETVRQKMAELKTTMSLYDAHKEEAWRGLMMTDIGREKMQSIDTLARSMARRESERVAAVRQLLDGTLLLARAGLAVLILTSLFVLLALLRQARRLEDERHARSAELLTERDRLEAEVERRTSEITEIARHLQTVREDERSHLARELHDELGGLLTAAKLEVARIRKRVAGGSPEIGERITQLVRTLDAGIALKRRIIEDLRPSSLSNLGLKAALEILCREFADSSELQLHADIDDVGLEPTSQLTVYRVVQEALTNIAKYARAKHVDVALKSDGQRATVSIRDDGVGFDATSRPRAAHGLAGMRFRVQSATGELNVRSAPGAGTTIVASLPLS
jgi:signal transduction histidine kinase